LCTGTPVYYEQAVGLSWEGNLWAGQGGGRIECVRVRLLGTPVQDEQTVRLSEALPPTLSQGLKLVHFSAQLEPCVSQENTLHTLYTPQHPLNTGYTTPTRTPYP